MKLSYKDQITVFKAFSDKNRLRILELLSDGEKCACKLLEGLNIGQSSLSYHMKILCDSGVVEGWEVGKWTHYRISTEGIAKAMEMLKAVTAADPSDNSGN